MSVHIEWTQGIARTFDQGLSFEDASPFISVGEVDKIGPDTVQLSAELAKSRQARALSRSRDSHQGQVGIMGN